MNNLTLEIKKSKLDNIILNEVVDIEILDKLINSSLLKVVTNDINKIYFEHEKNQLIALRNLVKKNGIASIKYNKYKNIEFGRVMPFKNLSLFGLRKQLRHTLCINRYVDIDVVNAHPQILYQICKKNNIECKYLKKYIKHRDDYLNEVMDFYAVDRDDAKLLFIILLYFGTINKWFNTIENEPKTRTILKFLTKFEKELNDIGDEIIKHNSELSKQVENKKKKKDNKKEKKNEDNDKKNIKGSIVSHFLQEYEYRILEKTYYYCLDNGYIKNNICLLCHDGIMLEKEYYKPELLEELQQLIYKEFDLNLTFIEKPMSESALDILDDCLLPIQLTEYEIIKEEFEKTHFKLMEKTPKYVKIVENEYIENVKIENKYIDITIKKTELKERNRQEFKDGYENFIYIDEEGNEKNFVLDWFKDPKMRTYEGKIFKPYYDISKCNLNDKYYNTFEGFEIEKTPLIKTDVENSLIYKHLMNLCNNDLKVFEYVTHFLSRRIKNPEITTATALIFKSNEGAGKDLFFNWFANQILGRKYCYNSEKSDLFFGQFTSTLENKIFIIINETNSKDTFNTNENIKNSITTDYNTVNKKGIDPYQNKNYIGYVFLTNNENPIQVKTGDRRFIGIECNNSICNDSSYFNPLREEIKNKLYDKALYNYFISLDSDNYDFSKRPETEFYKNLKELNKPAFISFVENFINENTYKKLEFKIKSNSFYHEYNNFISKYNFKNPMTLTKFGIEIKKLDGITTEHLRDGNYIKMDVEKVKNMLKDKYGVIFGSSDFIDENNDSDDEDDDKKSPLDL